MPFGISFWASFSHPKMIGALSNGLFKILHVSEPPNVRCGLATARKSLNPRPLRHGIERRAIELPAIDVNDADGAAFGFQLGLHLRQLVSELIGAIGGDVQIFKDDAPLISEFIPDDEIECVIGHSEGPAFRFARHDNTDSMVP